MQTCLVTGTAFSANTLAPGWMTPRVMSFAIGSACSPSCCAAFCTCAKGKERPQHKLKMLIVEDGLSGVQLLHHRVNTWDICMRESTTWDEHG